MLGKTCTDVQVCIYILPHNTPTFSIAWFLWEEKVPFFYTQVMSSPHTKAWNCTWYIVLIVPNIKLLHISYLYSKKTEVQHLNTATYLQQPPLVPAHIRPPTGLAKSSPAGIFLSSYIFSLLSSIEYLYIAPQTSCSVFTCSTHFLPSATYFPPWFSVSLYTLLHLHYLQFSCQRPPTMNHPLLMPHWSFR